MRLVEELSKFSEIIRLNCSQLSPVPNRYFCYYSSVWIMYRVIFKYFLLQVVLLEQCTVG